jgi:hypothetical protein
MRVALYGLNIAALTASVFPAVVMFDAVERSHALSPIAQNTFVALLFAGAALCVVSGLALTKRRSPEPELAIRLLSVGALMLTGAIVWAVGVFEAV